MASAQLGNRVDEDEDWTPSIFGSVHGSQALVEFHSSWGGAGRARISLQGGRLLWDVTNRDGGQSWIPDHAILKRWKAKPPPKNPNWKPPATCSKAMMARPAG
jgi:hypothetical protein